MAPRIAFHNNYFKAASKDVWSLINETAAAAEKETGKKVVNLGQGFFSYSPPDFVINAGKQAFDIPSNNQYAPARGKPQLLKQLSTFYTNKFQRPVIPDNILVTTGANEGMLAVFFGFLNPGDEVIVFEPFFDQYISNIELTGAKVVYVPLHPPKDIDERNIEGSEWKIDYQELESKMNSKTRIIVVNSPLNPVGKIFSTEELTRIGELAIKHDLLILSDEVYENLYYGDSFPRFATLAPEIHERTLTVGSAGKAFCCTGYRIGWVVGPSDLIQYALAAHTRICFSSPSVMQMQIAQALEEVNNDKTSNNYMIQNREAYKKKFSILCKGFDELGLPYTKPEGAYYLLVSFKKVKIPEDYVFPEELQGRANDFKLAYWLIRELGVVAIPPSEFYTKENQHIAETLLRFAVCKDDAYLEEAVEKLRGLKKYL
ncbi:kynurenine--oxoglutarate transaminase [Saccharomycopsis crataegensis]|uniref:Kynurenine--oxoglutarate transaminase n=1 Tax=Saccharomycopsis crataegensis TaxID=43959 RepID=A0AAV5QKE3_9ASCO|nr:kynurenine--oxoglutarate transaminase [Saccharomycopsis crataegensis]